MNTKEGDAPLADDAARHAPHIQTVSACAFVLVVVLAFIAWSTLAHVMQETSRSRSSHERYEQCSEAANDLMVASDMLTSEARLFVITADRSHLDAYMDEIFTRKNRDKAVETLRVSSDGDKAYSELAAALAASNRLAERELYAMRITADAAGISPLPESLEQVHVSAAIDELSQDEKRAMAEEMMLGDGYVSIKADVTRNVDDCTRELMNHLRTDELAYQHRLDSLLIQLHVILYALVAAMALTVFSNHLLVVRPIREHATAVEQNEPLELNGAAEIRRVAESYNRIYEENHRRTMLLKREAETDALTGLLNRGSYDRLLEHHVDDIALVLMDIDLFKQVNDTFGHGTGDEVLKKVATVIADRFRTTDYACRIGGDEFAVIMTEIGRANQAVIVRKLEEISSMLRDTEDGLPEVTLSVGIALSSDLPVDGNLYHAADKALYEAKHRGRNRYAFFSEMQGEKG